MHTLRAGCIGLLMVATLSPPTLAADLGGGPPPRSEPYPYERPFSWTGLYIGAHLGYGWSNQDWQEDLSAVSTNHTGNGWLAGGQIGYNIQVNQFVFGVEADASNAWLDGGVVCPDVAFNCAHSYDWLASLRGRAGVAINNNRTFLYGTAGIAWANINYSATDAAGTPFGANFSDRHTGFVVGGGIEHMLSKNWSARVEYLHYDFDAVTAPAGTLGAGAARLEPSTDTVRFGLNFKF